MSEGIDTGFPFVNSFKRRRKKTKKTHLSFKLTVETKTKCEEIKSHEATTKQDQRTKVVCEDPNYFEYDDNLEDFFSETHEDESGKICI
jgi:hypothetical protein